MPGGGYEAPDLLDAIAAKYAVWQPGMPDTPGMAALRASMALLDRPHVLDFGGALGAHYHQVRGQPCKWSVIETPGMVARGKPTSELGFYSELPDRADIIYSSGTIQSLADPYGMLGKLAAIPAKLLIIDRLALAPRTGFGTQYTLLSDNGPGPLVGFRDRVVSYPFAFLREKDVLNALKPWKLSARVALPEIITVSGIKCPYYLLVLTRD